MNHNQDGLSLIVTAALDEAATVALDALRRAHFPPERLVVGAHLTLFHKLPGTALERVRGDLEAVAADVGPLDGTVARVMGLGRGVAFALDVPGLAPLRRQLADRWVAMLTPQDAGGFRAHVTVQNKVMPAAARELRDALADGFEPWPVRVEALGLWWYRGGPWEAEARVPLSGP